MVTFAMETTPKPAGPISAKATPRSLVATPASPVSPQANREARPPLTPRTRDGPGGMVSIGSPSSESVLVPIGVETPRSTGRATSTPSTPATPSTPFMRAEIDAIKLGAGYKDMEGQKRRCG